MILAILQARTSSSRLPGKVLKSVLGQPMVLREMERLDRSQRIDKLILATSVDSSDDELAETVRAAGYDVYRGSLDDVLTRYYRCAQQYGAEHIVRVTGDCPLIDADVTDFVIKTHIKDGNDYTACVNPPTYPDGLDTEVMTMKALTRAWQEAAIASEREHVTLFLHNHAEEFKIGNVRNDEDLSKLRWTVDEPEDFAFVTAVYERLYPQKPDFTMQDILALLQAEPELAHINDGFMRNEGLAKLLREDRIVKGED